MYQFVQRSDKITLVCLWPNILDLSLGRHLRHSNITLSALFLTPSITLGSFHARYVDFEIVKSASGRSLFSHDDLRWHPSERLVLFLCGLAFSELPAPVFCLIQPFQQPLCRFSWPPGITDSY